MRRHICQDRAATGDARGFYPAKRRGEIRRQSWAGRQVIRHPMPGCSVAVWSLGLVRMALSTQTDRGQLRRGK
mgnify:CR=1 FL=1|jgi:hypothetical protein